MACGMNLTGRRVAVIFCPTRRFGWLANPKKALKPQEIQVFPLVQYPCSPLRSQLVTISLCDVNHDYPPANGRKNIDRLAVGQLYRLSRAPRSPSHRNEQRLSTRASSGPRAARVSTSSATVVAGRDADDLGLDACGRAGRGEVADGQLQRRRRCGLHRHPPIALIGRSGCTKSGSLMPWPAGLAHIAARHAASSGVVVGACAHEPRAGRSPRGRTGSCGPGRRR